MTPGKAARGRIVSPNKSTRADRMPRPSQQEAAGAWRDRPAGAGAQEVAGASSGQKELGAVAGQDRMVAFWRVLVLDLFW